MSRLDYSDRSAAVRLTMLLSGTSRAVSRLMLISDEAQRRQEIEETAHKFRRQFFPEAEHRAPAAAFWPQTRGDANIPGVLDE